MSHAPVMLEEAVHALAPRDGGLYVDCTFGAGGYARAILAANDTRVLALDRDPSARPTADALRTAAPGRFVFVSARFGDLEEVLAASPGAEVDGIVADLGVSSMQLDRPERGFSFRNDGPLDMRMGGEGATAADAVAKLEEAALADVLWRYGEEKKSRRIARAIVEARAEAPITGTLRLAEIVAKAIGGPPTRIHPATRTFQALRIYVNDELGELVRLIEAAERALVPGGRLVIVTFHSLEDRIVKDALRLRAGATPSPSRHAPPAPAGDEPTFRLLTSGAKTPSEAEVADNPRARSAKLRAAVRTAAPAPPPGSRLAEGEGRLAPPIEELRP